MPNSAPVFYKNGKPTWAAKADLLNPPAPALPVPNLAHSASGQGLKTCWYWKNSTCVNTPEDCHYLHKYSSAGVAGKPHRTYGQQKHERERRSPVQKWRQPDADAGEQLVSEVGTEADDNVLGEMADGLESPAGDAFDDWGISTYKTPHQRDGQAAIASNGW